MWGNGWSASLGMGRSRFSSPLSHVRTQNYKGGQFLPIPSPYIVFLPPPLLAIDHLCDAGWALLVLPHRGQWLPHACRKRTLEDSLELWNYMEAFLWGRWQPPHLRTLHSIMGSITLCLNEGGLVLGSAYALFGRHAMVYGGRRFQTLWCNKCLEGK